MLFSCGLCCSRSHSTREVIAPREGPLGDRLKQTQREEDTRTETVQKTIQYHEMFQMRS